MRKSDLFQKKFSSSPSSNFHNRIGGLLEARISWKLASEANKKRFPMRKKCYNMHSEKLLNGHSVSQYVFANCERRKIPRLQDTDVSFSGGKELARFTNHHFHFTLMFPTMAWVEDAVLFSLKYKVRNIFTCIVTLINFPTRSKP